MIVICLKTLLQQGISEPVFYGHFSYKGIVGKPNVSGQFKKIIERYKRVGYTMDIIRQSACLVVTPIMVDSYMYDFSFELRDDGPGLRLNVDPDVQI